MFGPQHIYLLTFMVAVASTIRVCLAFTIDTENPTVVKGDQNGFFGYKVLQYKHGEKKGILITAPLSLNGTGKICKHNENTCFSRNAREAFETNTTVKHLGLSIAAHSSGSQFTVCSPSVSHECNENSYLNSICYNITDELQENSYFKPAFQNCTKKTVDLVFLFDGSTSMTQAEFEKNKVFITEIMDSLKNTSIKFAAVQFASDYRKVFDFNDYISGTALSKLKAEPHLKGLTNTYTALTFVLKAILENPAAGASHDAIKVLLLITDGDPSQLDRNNIVKQYDDKKIIRLVIGLKEANLDKFRAIASEPKDKNAFKIEKYDGLKDLLENFQNKIFAVEGSKIARAGELTEELSQSGFSAIYHKDTLILGSVGSKSWSGSIREYQGEKETTIEVKEMEMDSYMGYTVSVGERKGIPLYFTGAPRFNHIGQVVLFKQNDKNWGPEQSLNGDQIGSYFGAELCSVDVNSDTDTDFLLVGAPMFSLAQEQKEGQIYIYSLNDEWKLKNILNVIAPSNGRFGTTISSLADLNGDGLRDVAVGAPLEDDSGAVYIYLGDRQYGIRSHFSQRITGNQILGIPGRTRFFGQAIDGHIDLEQDGLPDIVVGSQGAVFVLRSRPVFNLQAHLSYQPKELSTSNIDCVNRNGILHMVDLTACFDKSEATKSKQEQEKFSLNITYELNVDPVRKTFRGFFSETDKNARKYVSTLELVDKTTCMNFSIYMPKCVEDTLSPIVIKLNFSQAESEKADAILNVDNNKQSVVEVPFEKQCRTNETCIAELNVDFDFMTPTLLVRESNYFNVSVSLENVGDDSYNTTLIMYYPLGLSFSMMTPTKQSRPTLHSCKDLPGVLDKTICDVNLPVYRSKSSATFKASFHIESKYEWNETMAMTIAAKSDNQNDTKKAVKTKNILVQYEIKMLLTVEDSSINYLNFTTEDTEPKEINITYKIHNTGFKDFPINVTLNFPTKLDHNFEMIDYDITVEKNETKCETLNTTSQACLLHVDVSLDSLNLLKILWTEDGENFKFLATGCPPERECKDVVCSSFNLKKNSAAEFTLSGKVHFRDLKTQNIAFLKRYTGDSGRVQFESSIRVGYDTARYVLESHQKQNKGGSTHNDSFNDPTIRKSEVRVEFIILPHQLTIISTGAGLGLLLLILITFIMCKMGCFKRKKYGEEEESEREREIEDGLQDGTLSAFASRYEPLAQSDTTDKSDKVNGTDQTNAQNSEGGTAAAKTSTNGQLSQSETDAKSEDPPEEQKLTDDVEANENITDQKES